MSQNSYNEVLNKAKCKYTDLIKKLKETEVRLNDNMLEHVEYNFLIYKMNMFQAEIALLEDIFGANITQEIKEESFYSEHVLSIKRDLDRKIQELKELEKRYVK